MDLTPKFVIYALVFCAGFLALQTLIGVGRQASKSVKLANDRLRRMQSEDTQATVLAQMRKSRSLSRDGADIYSVMQ